MYYLVLKHESVYENCANYYSQDEDDRFVCNVLLDVVDRSPENQVEIFTAAGVKKELRAPAYRYYNKAIVFEDDCVDVYSGEFVDERPSGDTPEKYKLINVLCRDNSGYYFDLINLAHHSLLKNAPISTISAYWKSFLCKNETLPNNDVMSIYRYSDRYYIGRYNDDYYIFEENNK